MTGAAHMQQADGHADSDAAAVQAPQRHPPSLMVIPHHVLLVVEEAAALPGAMGTNQGPADERFASRVPKSMQHKPPAAGDYGLSEPQAVAHFTKLSQKNFGNDTALYPLGSCTMKHNPKACDEVAGWSMVNLLHPNQDPRTVQG
ncbi:MAG: hypothetical protein LC620_00835, partial [Halobacteriales archaeon]|nr:hypothetical protein [Halobacteriales archaeon]